MTRTFWPWSRVRPAPRAVQRALAWLLRPRPRAATRPAALAFGRSPLGAGFLGKTGAKKTCTSA